MYLFYIAAQMESKKKAIYVHGLGSGAASTTTDIVRKVFSDYEWTPLEVNEDPVDSVNIINHTIGQLHPAFLVGTSLGGLYLMYADMDSCEENAISFIFNPACDIARVIRETIGFGTKEYFVPRQDGIQEYVLDESICARFEHFIAEHQPTLGKRDYAMFSIKDELIGPAGVRNNQRVCYEIGYRILIDWEGGHRLKRQTLRLSWTHLFDERKTKYRIGDRILFNTREPGEHFHRYYGEGGPINPCAKKKEEFVGVINDIYLESTPQLYSAITFAPLSFYCSFVSDRDIKRLATDEDLERLCRFDFNI